MPDIVAGVDLAIAKDNSVTNKPRYPNQITMAGAGFTEIPFVATTSPTALVLPATITTPGFCWLVNNETSGSGEIQLGGNNATGFVGVVAAKPGQRWPFVTPLPSNGIYVKSAAGTVKGTLLVANA